MKPNQATVEDSGRFVTARRPASMNLSSVGETTAIISGERCDEDATVVSNVAVDDIASSADHQPGLTSLLPPTDSTSMHQSPSNPGNHGLDGVGGLDETAASPEEEERLLRAAMIGFREQRLSMHGRPLGLQRFRKSRRDADIRRFQTKVYNFLERPKDWVSISYHIIV